MGGLLRCSRLQGASLAAHLRLASHPAWPLSRREEIVNTFLDTKKYALARVCQRKARISAKIKA